MVFLMTTHEDEVISFGPCSEKEFIDILPLLEASKPPSMRFRDIEHYHIRDFHREALDKSREDVRIKEILDRMGAMEESWKAAAETATDGRVDELPEADQAVAGGDDDAAEAGPSGAVVVQVKNAQPATNKPAKKGLKWKPEPEIAEFPLRILRGASGVIFHQTATFGYCAFFDDEKRADSVAAFSYGDILPVEVNGEMVRIGPETSLRFQAVTFDAERLLDEIVQGEVAFDYVAYEVRFKGEKKFG